ncbi:uncharacterized protein PGTG_14229 [Puccinia graminis f. sp. tritici CRL 75-36-700-3]|uniref:Uncharacterized protein n=1 Tax=Puccinia graminis f. sp. tritici (strain CRL 75-36-700-3 / race SCCL) TaxID=418459 RepID=E3KWZ7_PUCGT|nr:uncharacterized protein PGTG_14229 [Puccinia graminis f. sp. tritici CRL 75-36-700-3]EFP88890.2 hypothetical protein PGTG_14229 [Puccinia graminis f. sp. tritici CRL 75-36-700-3]
MSSREALPTVELLPPTIIGSEVFTRGQNECYLNVKLRVTRDEANLSGKGTALHPYSCSTTLYPHFHFDTFDQTSYHVDDNDMTLQTLANSSFGKVCGPRRSTNPTKRSLQLAPPS